MDYMKLAEAELERADDIANRDRMESSFRSAQIERCYVRAEIYAMLAVSDSIRIFYDWMRERGP